MINKIIRKKIDSDNVSIYELSQKSGVAYATLHNIISGKAKNPRIGTLIKIANALDEPLQNLIEVKDSEKNSFKNQKSKSKRKGKML